MAVGPGRVTWGSKENSGPIAYGQASLEQAQNPRTSHIILIFSNKWKLPSCIQGNFVKVQLEFDTINKCFSSFLKSALGKKVDFLLMGHGLNKLSFHDPQHNDLVHTWNQNKRTKLFSVGWRECFRTRHLLTLVFPGGVGGKKPSCQLRKLETEDWSLGWEDLLEEGMANHSSILAYRIPWTEEPGWLQSIVLQRLRHDSSDLARTHLIT